MSTALLARLQFGMTVSFHYIFPSLTIGLAVLLVAFEALHLLGRGAVYHRLARFWTRVFGLLFALGVVTGMVMEFEFGMNWGSYSRFVGDVFGSMLAAEALLAFLLESTFLGLLLFGWERLSPRAHRFSTAMIALGTHLSAFFIVAANSWQQTPAGFRLVGAGSSLHAELTDLGAAVLNPSTLERFGHVVCGAWQAGAFLVLSVSAWHLLRGRHEEPSRAALRCALVLAALSSLGQLATGHASAMGVSRNQPAKLAAFEGHFPSSAPADLQLFGWVDEGEGRLRSNVPLPGLLSFLVHFDRTKPVAGLAAFRPEDRPPVNPVFQSYHAMVAIGMGLIALSLAGLFFWWRGTLFRARPLLWLFALSFVGPLAANQLGWFSAEVGRQPWVVYGILRTSDALSRSVPASQVLLSLLLFIAVYALLFALFLFLFHREVERGPSLEGAPEEAS